MCADALGIRAVFRIAMRILYRDGESFGSFACEEILTNTCIKLDRTELLFESINGDISKWHSAAVQQHFELLRINYHQLEVL